MMSFLLLSISTANLKLLAKALKLDAIIVENSDIRDPSVQTRKHQQNSWVNAFIVEKLDTKKPPIPVVLRVKDDDA